MCSNGQPSRHTNHLNYFTFNPTGHLEQRAPRGHFVHPKERNINGFCVRYYFLNSLSEDCMEGSPPSNFFPAMQAVALCSHMYNCSGGAFWAKGKAHHSSVPPSLVAESTTTTNTPIGWDSKAGRMTHTCTISHLLCWCLDFCKLRDLFFLLAEKKPVGQETNDDGEEEHIHQTEGAGGILVHGDRGLFFG